AQWLFTRTPTQPLAPPCPCYANCTLPDSRPRPPRLATFTEREEFMYSPSREFIRRVVSDASRDLLRRTKSGGWFHPLRLPDPGEFGRPERERHHHYTDECRRREHGSDPAFAPHFR